MKIATGLSKVAGMRERGMFPPNRTFIPTTEEVVRAAIAYDPPARREQIKYNKEIQDRDYKGRYVLKDN